MNTAGLTKMNSCNLGLELPLDHKHTVENCMDVQYIVSVVGKGIDMSDRKHLFQQALEVIIDGVSLSGQEEERALAGAYIMKLVVADNPDLLDEEKVKAIDSIIQMADEVDLCLFRPQSKHA